MGVNRLVSVWHTSTFLSNLDGRVFLCHPPGCRKIPPAAFSVRLDPQRGPGRLTNSAARTDVVLLIRRTVRPRGYASGFDSPVAWLDSLFEHPA